MLHLGERNQDGKTEKEVTIKRILRKTRRLDEITIQNKFSKKRRNDLLEYTEKYATKEVVEDRRHDLNALAKKRFNSTSQMLIKIMVLIIGSFVYSNTFRLYTASFGSLAWLTAIIGGFAASGGVDFLATEACLIYLNRQIPRKALNKLERQKDQELTKGENNLFHRQFWDTKIKLVYDIEGGILASSHEIKIAGRKISIYIIGALILNLIEGVGAFYLVSKLGLFDNLPVYIQAVISSLPVVITWMFAFVQAQWFHRSEYVRQLIRKYQKKAEEMKGESESINTIHKKLIRLEAGIDAILSRNSEYPTVELAEIDAEKRHCVEEIAELKERAKIILKAIEKEYEQKKIDFTSEYPKFEADLEELTPIQIEAKRKDYEAKRRQDLSRELNKIDEKKKEKITKFNSEIQEKLQELEIQRNLAEQKFNEKKAEFQNAQQVSRIHAI